MSTVFSDVCKTPTLGGPVPIPYPNVGKSADTTLGPTSVKNDGVMPMTKDLACRRTASSLATGNAFHRCR
jgi:hypothetical protein